MLLEPFIPALVQLEEAALLQLLPTEDRPQTQGTHPVTLPRGHPQKLGEGKGGGWGRGGHGKDPGGGFGRSGEAQSDPGEEEAGVRGHEGKGHTFVSLRWT